MGNNIRHFRELDVCKLAMEAAAMQASIKIFEVTKGFPVEERYSLTDEVRRSIAEARRRGVCI
jgi:hypothetical protein